MNYYGAIFFIILSYLAVFWLGVGASETNSDFLGGLAGLLHVVAVGGIIYAMLGGFGLFQ